MRWQLVAFVASTTLLACKREPSELATSRCRGDVGPFSGEATHYDADGKGNCSFDVAPDRMVAAMNHTDYEGAIWCGACVRVFGSEGADIVVRIVDSCPGCKRGDLDLSREAFAKLAPLDRGRIPIQWHPVPCDVTGPLEYRFKDRSNAFWTGVQIRNHRYAIHSVEARDAKTGAYTPIQRTDYNYFVATKGLGKGPFTFRITDWRGNVVEDTNIELGDGVTRQGTAQQHVCP